MTKKYRFATSFQELIELVVPESITRVSVPPLRAYLWYGKMPEGRMVYYPVDAGYSLKRIFMEAEHAKQARVDNLEPMNYLTTLTEYKL
jgi:hypothetical protein